MRLDDAVHDGDGRAGDLVDRDVAVLERGVSRHGEEEEIAALLGRTRVYRESSRGELNRQYRLLGRRAGDRPGWLAPCSR